MTGTSWTPAPSSVNSRTPSAASSPMGASRSPARPTVMAPATATWHIAPSPSDEDFEGHRRTVDRRVGVGHGHHRREAPQGGGTGPGLHGLGLLGPGLAQMGVEVDEARGHQASAGVEHRGAARARQVGPDRERPLRPRPRRRPTRSPVASTTVPPRITMLRAAATARPDSAAQPPTTSRGSRASARRRRRRAHLTLPEQQEEHRHAHRHAVGHLAQHERLRQVGDVVGDLDAPVHRPGMHHEGVVGQQTGPTRREPVAGGVLAQRGQEGAGPALGLQAQEVDTRRHAAARRRGRATPSTRASPRATAAGGSPAPPG